jgi:PilZ domain
MPGGKGQSLAGMSLPQNTRRWPRHPVDLQVRVVAAGGAPETTVPGRGTEMSEGGMLLYAGILLNPGDMLELEFNTPSHSRMTAVVRYRNGYCFGLEFVAPITT